MINVFAVVYLGSGTLIPLAGARAPPSLYLELFRQAGAAVREGQFCSRKWTSNTHSSPPNLFYSSPIVLIENLLPVPQLLLHG